MEKFRNNKFRINWPYSKPLDPENEAVDVRLTTQEGDEYSANFITMKLISYLFKKNKRTGEFAGGTYFCMPGMIIVERITDENIKRTIDCLIKDYSLEHYFTKIG